MDDPSPPPSPRESIQELDALLDDPERWNEVDPEKLRHLLFYQCLSYGLQPDEERIPTLMSLHRVAVERLHAAVRRQVVIHLARAIERVHREHHLREGAGCTNGLLPFLLEDPDPSVVSSAATEMALLLPLESGDPLTGPRYVRSLLAQVSGDEAKAGIVGGLLQLGDLRVAPLVADAWKGLGHEGRETLALLIQGFRGVHTLTVDFLAAWLEDEVSQAGAAAFGVVAATLARAGRHASEHGASEVRRAFPLTEAPESQPFEVVREIGAEELARSLQERLLRVAQLEQPPQLMPHVLSYWGLHGPAYRLAARGASLAAAPSADPASGLCEPVRLELAPDWPEQPEEETLLEWGVFNPLGPTINTLRLTPVDAAWALVYTQYHPAESVSRVMGLLARGTAPTPAPTSLVRAIMERNGRHGIWLLRSLPDYVYLPERSPLGRVETGACLAAAREAAVRAGDEPVDLTVHAERLQRLAADPWETTRREIDQAMRGASAESPAPGIASAASADYVRWLEVAASPAHVEAVRSQLPLAWQRLHEGERSY